MITMRFSPLLILVVSLLVCRSLPALENPFARFIGDWTLKEDRWQQRWDGETTETISIENHFTECRPLNTPMSVLCEVTAPALAGHILWTYDPVRNKVNHLSSFGDQRIGFGEGVIDENGNLDLRIKFASEGPEVVRHYRYEWISKNEYYLHSAQHRAGKATSNFYAGTFVRMPTTP